MNKLKVAIVGVGLIGGSLGLAFKAALGDKISICGIDANEASLQTALERHAVDTVSADCGAGVAEADIVFLCTPVLQIVPIVGRMLPHLKARAIITDTGSTKQYVLDRLQKLLPDNIDYVPGHPMAGKEHSGIQAADKELFRHKAYVIIDDSGASERSVAAVCELIKLTGANIVNIDIAQHDRCAAVISHVPHVAAAAMVTLLSRNSGDFDANLKLAGGGFKDTTRIASSNADMWSDICLTNSAALIDSLNDLKSIIDDVIDGIETNDRERLYDYFYKAKQARDGILDKTHELFEI